MHFVIDVYGVDFVAIGRIAVSLYEIVEKKNPDFVFLFSTFKIQINFLDVIFSIIQFLLLKDGQCQVLNNSTLYRFPMMS